jgi:hypothetical protein
VYLCGSKTSETTIISFYYIGSFYSPNGTLSLLVQDTLPGQLVVVEKPKRDLADVYDEEAAFFPDLIPVIDGKLAIPPLRENGTVMAFLGANQPYLGYQEHSDGLRANAVRHLYDVQVYTVGSQVEDRDFPLHVQAHFDVTEIWTGTETEEHGHDTRMSVLGLNLTIAPEIIVLDYFFLVRTYFDHRMPEDNGYSNEWFTGIASGVIRSGPTQVMLLPNDCWGEIQDLRKRSEVYNNGMRVHSTRLTLSETQKYHPLWYATAVATSNSAWWDTLPKKWQKSGNLNSLRAYLNQTHPIMMVYDGDKFDNRNEALQYLQSLKLPQVIAAEREAADRSYDTRNCIAPQ